MVRRTLPLRAVMVVAGLALLAPACSSSKTSNGAGTTTAASTTVIDTTTTAAAPTTTASTVPPTTVPAPIVFNLHGDGIGPFNLGISAAELIDAMTTQFGPPSSDVSAEYPLDDTFGGFTTADGEVGFVASFGRTVCWSFQFCAEFGGGDAVTQSFVGWTYGEESGLTLASTSGVTIGSRWSDFPAMVVDSGGCYNSGTGSIDGITLILQSDVIAFSSYDDLGNYVVAVPPAEQVAVISMQIGEIPTFLFGDC